MSREEEVGALTPGACREFVKGGCVFPPLKVPVPLAWVDQGHQQTLSWEGLDMQGWAVSVVPIFPPSWIFKRPAPPNCEIVMLK